MCSVFTVRTLVLREREQGGERVGNEGDSELRLQYKCFMRRY